MCNEANVTQLTTRTVCLTPSPVYVQDQAPTDPNEASQWESTGQYLFLGAVDASVHLC